MLQAKLGLVRPLRFGLPGVRLVRLSPRPFDVLYDAAAAGLGLGNQTVQRRNALGVELRGLGIDGVVADAVVLQDTPCPLALCRLVTEEMCCDHWMLRS